MAWRSTHTGWALKAGLRHWSFMQMWYDKNQRPSQALRGSPDTAVAPLAAGASVVDAAGLAGSLASLVAALGGVSTAATRSLTEATAAAEPVPVTRAATGAALAGLAALAAEAGAEAA